MKGWVGTVDDAPQGVVGWHARHVHPTWTDAARHELTDFTRCPACAAALTAVRCGRCGLDLGGPDGARIAAASRTAARALDDRRAVLDAVRAAQGARPASGAQPTRWSPAGAVPPTGAPGPLRPATPRPVPPRPAPPLPVPQRPAPAPERAFDVSRLFALAGAGLVAAAALVFASFWLADEPVARLAVLVLTTAVAAGGTLALRRTGLAGSAEAVGGLVAALAVVDAWMAALLVDGSARWLVLAMLLLAVGLGLPAAGLAVRVRSWTVAVLVLPVVPLGIAGSVGTPWAVELGLLAAALVTLVRAPFHRTVRERFGSGLPAIGVLLALAALGLVLAGLAVGLVLPEPVPGWASGGVAVALLLGAVVMRLQVAAGEVTPGESRAWVWAAGASAVLAAAVAPVSVLPQPLGTAPVAGAVVWALLVLVPRWAGGDPGADPRYRAQVSGGWVALVATTVPGALVGIGAALALVGRLERGLADLLDPAVFARVPLGGGAGPVLALAVLAAALAAIGRVPLVHVVVPAAVPVPRGPVPPGWTPTPVFGPQRPPLRRAPAVQTLGRACLPVAVVLTVWVAVALLRPWAGPLLVAELALAAGLVEGARRIVPGTRGTWRSTLVVAAFAQTAFLAVLTWVSVPTTAIGAVAVVALLLRARPLVTDDVRGVLVALGTAYAGGVLAVVLGSAGWDAFGVIGAVAVALLLVAAALTVLRRVGVDTWFGVLVVAVVPAVLGIAAVAVDRTWWGAGVAAALLLLEVVLLGARAQPVPAWLRVLAAALVVPTVSVVVICAGAVLLPGSGSPVLLPVVAVLAAAAAVAAPAVADGLDRRVPGMPATSARVAVELAAAGTAAVALLLGVVRVQTGADTVLALCAVLAAGATAVAQRPDRRRVWWAAATLWSGVLWSALVWAGVGLVEAYTAPPAVVAVVVGALLSRRADRWRPLIAAGTALLVVPTLLLAVAGQAVGTRAAVLLAVAAVAVVVGLLDRRAGAGSQALAALAEPLLVGGAAAALAGAVRAAHLAADTPVGSGVANARLFGAALVWSLVGAVLLGALGLLLADRRAAGAAVRGPGDPAVARAAAVRRWALAPALVAFTVGALVAVRPSWALTWTGWVIEIALLGLAIAAVRAEATRPRSALAAGVPPGWVLWGAALAWAIGAWSTRELRVEVFALPLGLALTAMGWVALHAALATPAPGPARPGVSWPVGRRTSVAALTPGILATLGPSVLAIWTDPMTWRAILVVVLALAFMLEGAREMLRAPLVVGAGALPVAVLSVFAAQIGGTISAGPWLLTLLAAGGLLLVLGVFAERRRSAATAADPPVGAGVLR